MAFVLTAMVAVNGTMAEDGAALKAAALKAWDARSDLNQALVAAQTFEKAAKALPNDVQAADLAVRSWYWLGINTTDMKKKQEYHQKGYDLGMALAKVQPKNVGVYYFSAANISRYAQTLGSTQQKLYFTKINPLMDKVKELNPNYFYGGFPRYMAILTVEMSPSLRSIMAAARKDFKFTLEEAEQLIGQATKLEPRYLLNHTTLAEIYLAQGKKAEAKAKLDWVLKQDPGALATEKPENVFEQNRAKEMLKKCN